MDFGGLKAFKEWAEWTFDHTLVVAIDDPHLPLFKKMADLGLQDKGGICDLRVVPAVGCEKFSELVYKEMAHILYCFQNNQPYKLTKGIKDDGQNTTEFRPRYPVGQGVKLKSAEVFEHDGNSAVYEGAVYEG